MLIVGVSILALDGVGGNAVFHQRRRHIVLGAEGIGGAEDDIGPARL